MLLASNRMPFRAINYNLVSEDIRLKIVVLSQELVKSPLVLP